jgi:hypothetical protein
MTWATYREGKAADWIVGDLEAVLGPWLDQSPPARGSTPSRKKRAGRR